MNKRLNELETRVKDNLGEALSRFDGSYELVTRQLLDEIPGAGELSTDMYLDKNLTQRVELAHELIDWAAQNSTTTRKYEASLDEYSILASTDKTEDGYRMVIFELGKRIQGERTYLYVENEPISSLEVYFNDLGEVYSESTAVGSKPAESKDLGVSLMDYVAVDIIRRKVVPMTRRINGVNKVSNKDSQ